MIEVNKKLAEEVGECPMECAMTEDQDVLIEQIKSLKGENDRFVLALHQDACMLAIFIFEKHQSCLNPAKCVSVADYAICNRRLRNVRISSTMPIFSMISVAIHTSKMCAQETPRNPKRNVKVSVNNRLD